MKLAEALSIRADLQRKVNQLKERILRNAKIQVDEKPAEDQNELLLELEQASKELVVLVRKINKTNNVLKFDLLLNCRFVRSLLCRCFCHFYPQG